MFYQVLYDYCNDLCDFYDLYTSLSVTFVMCFNGQNKDIYYYYYYYYILLLLLLLLQVAYSSYSNLYLQVKNDYLQHNSEKADEDTAFRLGVLEMR